MLGNIFGSKQSSEMDTKATLDRISLITQVPDTADLVVPENSAQKRAAEGQVGARAIFGHCGEGAFGHIFNSCACLGRACRAGWSMPGRRHQLGRETRRRAAQAALARKMREVTSRPRSLRAVLTLAKGGGWWWMTMPQACEAPRPPRARHVGAPSHARSLLRLMLHRAPVLAR